MNTNENPRDPKAASWLSLGLGLTTVAAIALLAKRANDAKPRTKKSARPGDFSSLAIKGEPDFLKVKWFEFAERFNSPVRFHKAPAGRGTVMTLATKSDKAKQSLRRFKQLIETGEILRTEGQPSGRKHSTSRKYDRFAA